MSITFNSNRHSCRTGFAVTCYGYGPEQDWRGPVASTSEEAIESHRKAHVANLDCDFDERRGTTPCYDTDADPSVNMSNTNAYLLLSSLGFGDDAPAYGSVSADDFLGRVLMALAVAPQDEGIPSYQVTGNGISATYYEGGRSSGYIQHRLDQLRTVAEFARANNTDVSWG
jgi:hypothetical protein